MKRIIVFLFSIFFSSFLYGQIMENGNFGINAGNDIGFSCTAAAAVPTFSDGSIPNWIRMFGSPNMHGCPDARFGLLAYPHTGTIFMSSKDNKGEGIAGGYPFIVGETYEIHVGVIELVGTFPTVRVVVGKNPIPTTSTCGFVCGTMETQGTMPIPTPLPPTMHELTFSPFTAGDNSINFTPTDNFDWIAVFPQTSSCIHQTDVTVKFVEVFRDCTGDLHLPNVMVFGSTFSIYPTLYTAYQHIYAGPTSGITMNIDPSAKTHFKASESIVLSKDFVATASGSYFLAEIAPEVCDGFPASACALDGPNCVRVGEIVNFTPGIPGGHWSSSNTAFATVNSIGRVKGIAPTTGVAGTSVYITYTIGGCTQTKTIVVDPTCEDYGRPAPTDGTLLSANNGQPSSLSVNDVSPNIGEAISVFPNPVKNSFTVSGACNASGELLVRITDVNGRTRHTESIMCNDGSKIQTVIDIGDFAPGVYFIDLTLNDQHVVKKITKL